MHGHGSNPWFLERQVQQQAVLKWRCVIFRNCIKEKDCCSLSSFNLQGVTLSFETNLFAANFYMNFVIFLYGVCLGGLTTAPIVHAPKMEYGRHRWTTLPRDPSTPRD
jgi:hypothetical protein